MKIISYFQMCIVDDEYLEKYLAYLKIIKPITIKYNENLLQFIIIIMYYNTMVHGQYHGAHKNS